MIMRSCINNIIMTSMILCISTYSVATAANKKDLNATECSVHNNKKSKHVLIVTLQKKIKSRWKNIETIQLKPGADKNFFLPKKNFYQILVKTPHNKALGMKHAIQAGDTQSFTVNADKSVSFTKISNTQTTPN